MFKRKKQDDRVLAFAKVATGAVERVAEKMTDQAEGIKTLKATLDERDLEIEHLRAAIRDGGFDLGGCTRCGTLVVYLADGMPAFCRECIKHVGV